MKLLFCRCLWGRQGSGMTVSKINQLYFKVITTVRYNDKTKWGSTREGGMKVQFYIELG